MWLNQSHLSEKPLGSYIDDLILRFKFFNNWITKQHPTSYVLGYFRFPDVFLAGVL